MKKLWIIILCVILGSGLPANAKKKTVTTVKTVYPAGYNSYYPQNYYNTYSRPVYVPQQKPLTIYNNINKSYTTYYPNQYPLPYTRTQIQTLPSVPVYSSRTVRTFYNPNSNTYSNNMRNFIRNPYGSYGSLKYNF